MDFRLLLLAALALMAVACRGYFAAWNKRDPSLDRQVDGVLCLSAYFFCLGAAFLVLVSGWQAGREHWIKANWPRVEAEVAASSLVHNRGGAIRRPSEWDPEARRWTKDFYGVDSVFRYASDGRTRETTLYTCCSPSRARVERWRDSYRQGTRHRLHRSPDDPARLSLAGADAAIASQTPRNQARQAWYFAIVGSMFFFAGRALLLRRSRLPAPRRSGR